MASNEVEYHPKTKQSKFADAKEFLYNPQEGSFLGRTCVSWGKCLYCGKMLYYGGILMAFFECLDLFS